MSSLSLLSTRVLRLIPDNSYDNQEDIEYCKHNADTSMYSHLPEVVEVLIEPRTFYVLSGIFRYRYAHEILGKYKQPMLTEQLYDLDRRISVMLRDVK